MVGHGIQDVQFLIFFEKYIYIYLSLNKQSIYKLTGRHTLNETKEHNIQKAKMQEDFSEKVR